MHPAGSGGYGTPEGQSEGSSTPGGMVVRGGEVVGTGWGEEPMSGAGDGFAGLRSGDPCGGFGLSVLVGLVERPASGDGWPAAP